MESIESYRPALRRRVAARGVRNPTDVEELVQQSLRIAWEKRASCRNQRDPGSWIRSIADRQILDFLRHQERNRTVPLNDDFPCPTIDPDLRIVLDQAIEAVEADSPRRKAQMDVLRLDLEGFRTAEIATRLGVSVDAVKARRRRGLEVLRERFDEDPRVVTFVGHYWVSTRVSKRPTADTDNGGLWQETRAPISGSSWGPHVWRTRPGEDPVEDPERAAERLQRVLDLAEPDLERAVRQLLDEIRQYDPGMDLCHVEVVGDEAVISLTIRRHHRLVAGSLILAGVRCFIHRCPRCFPGFCVETRLFLLRVICANGLTVPVDSNPVIFCLQPGVPSVGLVPVLEKVGARLPNLLDAYESGHRVLVHPDGSLRLEWEQGTTGAVLRVSTLGHDARVADGLSHGDETLSSVIDRLTQIAQNPILGRQEREALEATAGNLLAEWERLRARLADGGEEAFPNSGRTGDRPSAGTTDCEGPLDRTTFSPKGCVKETSMSSTAVSRRVADAMESMARAEQTLRDEGVLRSHRDVDVDLTEWIISMLLGGRLAQSRTQRGWDVELTDGRKVQVRKDRKDPLTNIWRGKIWISNWPDVSPNDLAAIVMLDVNHKVVDVFVIPMGDLLSGKVGTPRHGGWRVDVSNLDVYRRPLSADLQPLR